MKTFATVLIKVNSGGEREVRDWLARKRDATTPTEKYCLEGTCHHVAACKEGDRTCDRLKVLALAAIGGSYDFAMVAAIPDIQVIEEFIIDCLRNGQLGKSIMDTHSLYGTLV